MLRPSPGDLLRGLREGLKSSVLPALPKGVAQRQLKAALHLLDRLERSWDLMGAHLAADNRDIETTLGAIADASLQAQLAAAPEAVPSGFNCPQLRAAAARNLQLQALLDDYAAAHPSPQVDALLRRMAARDSILTGDTLP